MPPRPLKGSKPNPKADAGPQDASLGGASGSRTDFQIDGQGSVPTESYKETHPAIAASIGETKAVGLLSKFPSVGV